MFDDVEVLDFAGPFEVFAVTRSADGEPAFDVVTVSLNGREVVARNGLRVLPTCSSRTLNSADILVVPGGLGTRREMHRPAMLSFLRGATDATELTLSVCTGALLLGAANLLEGKAATTHWGAMSELRDLGSGATIFPDARIVDNGQLILSAGVSAGIDAALYVVARLIGPTEAGVTAREMHYDWHPADGGTVVWPARYPLSEPATL